MKGRSFGKICSVPFFRSPASTKLVPDRKGLPQLRVNSALIRVKGGVAGAERTVRHQIIIFFFLDSKERFSYAFSHKSKFETVYRFENSAKRGVGISFTAFSGTKTCLITLG